MTDGVASDADGRGRDEDNPLAAPLAAPPRDPATGLLGKAAFLRLAAGVRHDEGAGSCLVRVTFAGTATPAPAGARLLAVLAPGDLAARWEDDQLVVLRHPLRDAVDAAVLGEAVGRALEPLGATGVEVSCSASPDESPLVWLRRPATRAPGASGTAATDGAEPRPATPASG